MNNKPKSFPSSPVQPINPNKSDQKPYKLKHEESTLVSRIQTKFNQQKTKLKTQNKLLNNMRRSNQMNPIAVHLNDKAQITRKIAYAKRGGEQLTIKSMPG